MGKPRKRTVPTPPPQPRQRSAAGRLGDRIEASALIRQVANGRQIDEEIRAVIARVAQMMGWEVSRTEDIWRQTAMRIDAWEMDELRTRARELMRKRG